MNNNRYAIITGASSGIGEAFAYICAANGHNLILVSRDKLKLEKVKGKIGEKVDTHIVALDLAATDSGERLSQYIQKHGLSIDLLINNAGFGDYAKFSDSEQTKLLSMIDLNVRSLTELTHRFLPLLQKQKQAYILNVASTAAFLPGPGMAVYYATKHYVLAFSEGLAEELKDRNVSVTALCPGPTASGFQAASDMEKSSLVKGRQLPSAQSVAQYGYEAMMRKKVVAVHGLNNKLAAQVGRLLPRSVLRRIVNKAQNN